LGIKDFMDSHRVIGHLYMIILIPLQWMVFAVSDLKDLGALYGRLVGIGGVAVNSADWTGELSHAWWLLILALVLSTELPAKLYGRFRKNPAVYVLLAGVLGVVIYCLAMGLDDPFMYFRF
ncbi:MAG: hypothetical protein IJM39_05085, partial [Firmicutes bacterium]|nr:hypothetical protein [Bacillota bacterium]